MSKGYSKRRRKHAVTLVWEVLIALALVSAVLAVANFYARHEQAPWMPPPEKLRLIGWSLAGFAFGAGYLYLAFSTLRLERKISNMPQLQAFITFSRRWFTYLGISIGFSIFGIWSLWPVVPKIRADRTNMEQPTCGSTHRDRIAVDTRGNWDSRVEVKNEFRRREVEGD